MPDAFIAWNEYSPAGNITSSTFQQPFMAGSTLPYFRYDYNYDSHYRLTSANYAHGYYFPLNNTAAYRVDNLSYDAAGNILSLRRRNQNGNIVDNLSYSYQGSTNRLQLVMDAAGKTHGWQAGTTYYSYDASGNLTVAEEFDYQGTIWEYTRDTRNQVIRAAGWGSEAITDYRYNFAGHRYYKHVSGGSWEYFGLDDGVRTGLFGQATPGPIWNILTPSGRVIGRNPYNGAPSYYVTDHLGSTRVVVSSNGSIQEAYDYYPFGLPMPGRSITGWSETPERFTGYYKDQESYLYYAQARMYDPAIGRFLSVDPHASNYPHLSPYVYVANNPLISIDPDGRDIWFVHGTYSNAETWEDIGIEAWEQLLNDNSAESFNWSGANTVGARQQAAVDLVNAILETYEPGMEINIVAHSHGGNVAILAANMLSEQTGGELSVDNLVTIATPSRNDYSLSDGAVGNHVNIFSTNDAMQRLGGFDTIKGSALTPGIVGGFPAGRVQQGATNINVTGHTSRNPIRSHSQMHNNPAVIRAIKP